jgi:hypothetical protein
MNVGLDLLEVFASCQKISRGVINKNANGCANRATKYATKLKMIFL